MTKSAEVLFALIRYALGTQVVDSDAEVLRDLRFADWSKFVDLAFEQGGSFHCSRWTATKVRG